MFSRSYLKYWGLQFKHLKKMTFTKLFYLCLDPFTFRQQNSLIESFSSLRKNEMFWQECLIEGYEKQTPFFLYSLLLIYRIFSKKPKKALDTKKMKQKHHASTEEQTFKY
jgi:hypothetical protein